MQICTLTQTNHATIQPLSFLQAGYPSCHPTNSVKALKAKAGTRKVIHYGFYWSKRWWSGSGISWTTCKSFAPRSRQIPCQYLITQLLQAGCLSCHSINSIKALALKNLSSPKDMQTHIGSTFTSCVILSFDLLTLTHAVELSCNVCLPSSSLSFCSVETQTHTKLQMPVTTLLTVRLLPASVIKQTTSDRKWQHTVTFSRQVVETTGLLQHRLLLPPQQAKSDMKWPVACQTELCRGFAAVPCRGDSALVDWRQASVLRSQMTGHIYCELYQSCEPSTAVAL